jgi:hypothetical protein
MPEEAYDAALDGEQGLAMQPDGSLVQAEDDPARRGRAWARRGGPGQLERSGARQSHFATTEHWPNDSPRRTSSTVGPRSNDMRSSPTPPSPPRSPS